jgi:hypothetical protein
VCPRGEWQIKEGVKVENFGIAIAVAFNISEFLPSAFKIIVLIQDY